MKSLLLDTVLWDLVVDSLGNIAVCTEPYAVAQDVACAVRVFQGEAWYDVTKGIPYFDQVFGKFSPSLYAALVNKEALTVPNVSAVRTIITSFKDRVLVGQIQITDNQGAALQISVGDQGGGVLLAVEAGSYVAPGYVESNYVK